MVELAAQGYAVPRGEEEDSVLELAGDLFQRYAEQSRLLSGHLSPPDRRIQDFLDDILRETGEKPVLPHQTLVVDRYGLSRHLSLPEKSAEYHNDQVSSYRLNNGVLH